MSDLGEGGGKSYRRLWEEVFMSHAPTRPINYRLTLQALRMHMGGEGRCYSTVPRMMKFTGHSKPTQIAHIRAAVRDGWVRKSPRSPRGDWYDAQIPAAALDAYMRAREERSRQLPLPLPPAEGKAALLSAGEGVKGVDARGKQPGAEGGNGLYPKLEVDQELRVEAAARGRVSSDPSNCDGEAMDTENRDGAVREMHAFMENHPVLDLFESPTRKVAFRSSLRGVIEGDTTSAWRTADGTPVRWADRARLFRLAVDLYTGKLCAPDRRVNDQPMEVAVLLARVVIPREYDPFATRPSNSPRPSTEHAAAAARGEPAGPRRSVDRRAGQSGPVAVGAALPVIPSAATRQSDLAADLAAAHPRSAERIRGEVEAAAAKDRGLQALSETIRAQVVEARVAQALVEQLDGVGA
jgi:hypothetical protein